MRGDISHYCELPSPPTFFEVLPTGLWCVSLDRRDAWQFTFFLVFGQRCYLLCGLREINMRRLTRMKFGLLVAAQLSPTLVAYQGFRNLSLL